MLRAWRTPSIIQWGASNSTWPQIISPLYQCWETNPWLMLRTPGWPESKWWQFTVIHTPGKLQMAADALSRRKGATVYKVSVHDTDDEEHGVMDDMKSRYKPKISNTRELL